MFFKKKRIKGEIPNDLLLQLRECQEKKRNEKPTIRYSLSASDEQLEKIKKEIKSKPIESSFAEELTIFLNKNGEKDSVVYKRAMVDRRLFNKIINGQDKYPSRNTVIKLALALKLSLGDLELLLKKSLSSLSNSEYRDIAIKYCFEHQIYDIEQVNDILYACDLYLL